MTGGSTGIDGNKGADYSPDINLDPSDPLDGLNGTNGTEGPVLIIQRQDLDGPPLRIKLPSLKDLPPPNQMTTETIVTYLEQLSSQLMQLGCALSKTQIEHHQKQNDIDTKDAQNKIQENAEKLKELEHKQKVAKAWKIGIFAGTMLLTLATMGTASGLMLVVAGASFVTTGISGGLELSGAMEKYAEKHPDEAKAIQITLLVIQCALFLFSIGAAWRAATTAGPEVAAMATDDTAAAASAGGKGVVAGGAEGASTATDAAGQTATAAEGATAESVTTGTEEASSIAAKNAAKSASKSATKKATEGVDDIADDVAEEGKAASDAGKASKGAKGKDAGSAAEAAEGVKKVDAEGIAGADDGVEELGETARRVKKLAKLLKRLAALMQGISNVAVGAVSIRSGEIKEDIADIQADMVELKTSLKLQKEMIQMWLKNMEDLVKDFNQTMETTATMYQSQQKAAASSFEGVKVSSPTPSGTV